VLFLENKRTPAKLLKIGQELSFSM
jgi:hypothetical protein